MSELHFLSYNVSKSSLLFDAIQRHVSSLPNVILFCQEVLPDFKFNPNYGLVEFLGQQNSQLRIFVSKNIAPLCIKCDSFERYQILDTKIGKFVNVHMQSDWRSSPTKSTKYMNLAKEIRSTTEFRLIGGDFNANPFEDVVHSPESWFSKRSLDDFTQKKSEALINPFWEVLHIGKNGTAQGSFPGSNEMFSRLQILDQFFVSHKDVVNVLDVGVVNQLSGTDIQILNKDPQAKLVGKPHKPVFVKFKI